MPAPATIEIKVDRIGQLFDTLDPLPFRERDLDREAEEFIVGWAREIPSNRPLRIVVHLPQAEAQSDLARDLRHAVAAYFRYRVDATTNELRELFRIGRYSLAIGLAVLAVCVAASRFALAFAGSSGIGRFFEEGLIILGWVANWRPVEIFLYEWWPIARRRRLYRRLAAADLSVTEGPAARPASGAPPVA